MNFVKVEIAAAGSEGVTVRSADLPPTPIPVHPGKVRAGDVATLGLRPENLSLPCAGATPIEGVVELVERLGRETGVRVTTKSGAALDAIIDGATAVVAQSTLLLAFFAESCHLFDSDGQALERQAVPEIADAPVRRALQA